MLELRNVFKYYGDSAVVNDVSLTVDDGEFVTLLGPSGSGKSTILGMIAGYLAPDRGSISLDGKDLRRVSAADRGIGVVFQHYALFPHMTVAQNVGYGLKRRRWPRRKIEERVAEMIALIGLEGMAGRRPSQLSGGQQQRVALARALAFEPALLLMDEPLGALDQEIRLQMQSEIRRIHRELHPSVVYVTHDKNEAFALSDRIGIMRKAELVALADAQTLYQEPKTAFVARFFGNHQLLEVEVREIYASARRARICVAGREVTMPVGQAASGVPVSLAIPRDTTSIGLIPKDALIVGGTIRDVVPMGPATFIHCAVEPGGQEIVAEIRSEDACNLIIGNPIQLGIAIDQSHLVMRDDVVSATKPSKGVNDEALAE